MDGATPREAQLALSYLVWPKECPDPRVVDEWLRRSDRLPARPAGGLTPDEDDGGERSQCKPAHDKHGDDDVG